MSTLQQSPTPGLQITVADEDMEISSNIDFDMEFANEDIDLMLEDSRSEAGADHSNTFVGPSNDDIMLDEDQLNSTADEDGVMADDVTVPDEQLPDVSLDDGAIFDLEDTTLLNDPMQGNENIDIAYVEEELNTQSHDIAPADEQKVTPLQSPVITENEMAQSVPQQQTTPQHSPSNPTLAQTSRTGTGIEESQQLSKSSSPSPKDPAATTSDDSNVAQYTEAQNESEFAEHTHTSPAQEIDPAQEEEEEEVHGEEAEGSTERADDRYNAYNAFAKSETIAEASKMPVIAYWEEHQLSLFPGYGDAFILTDTSMMEKPIVMLLQACRDVLLQNLNEDDELAMEIPSLGLFINEDCMCAENVTIQNIMIVHTSLYRNDNANPAPFEITLTKRIRAVSRLQRLVNAAAGGRGFSDLSFLVARQNDKPKDDNISNAAEQDDPKHDVEESAENEQQTGQYEEFDEQAGEDDEADKVAEEDGEFDEQAGEHDHFDDNADEHGEVGEYVRDHDEFGGESEEHPGQYNGSDEHEQYGQFDEHPEPNETEYAGYEGQEDNFYEDEYSRVEQEPEDPDGNHEEEAGAVQTTNDQIFLSTSEHDQAATVAESSLLQPPPEDEITFDTENEEEQANPVPVTASSTPTLQGDQPINSTNEEVVQHSVETGTSYGDGGESTADKSVGTAQTEVDDDFLDLDFDTEEVLRGEAAQASNATSQRITPEDEDYINWSEDEEEAEQKSADQPKPAADSTVAAANNPQSAVGPSNEGKRSFGDFEDDEDGAALKRRDSDPKRTKVE